MKVFDFRKILRYLGKKNPWQIIVIAFLIFLTFLMAANIYFFRKLGKEMTKPAIISEIKIQTLKRELLTKTIENFQEKEKLFRQNLLTKPDISDPSL